MNLMLGSNKTSIKFSLLVSKRGAAPVTTMAFAIGHIKISLSGTKKELAASIACHLQTLDCLVKDPSLS